MIKYKTEETNNETGERFYIDDSDIRYISNTTLLSLYENKEIINAWKERVGEAESDRIRDAAADNGKVIHSEIESYSANPDIACFEQYSPYSQIAINAFYGRVQILSSEETIFFSCKYKPKLRFAGRYDSLVHVPHSTFKVGDGFYWLPEGDYLVDLKTKFKYKTGGKTKGGNIPRMDTAEMILKNLLQGSAYVTAMNLDGANIRGFILVYATKTRCKTVYITSENIAFYWAYYYKLLLDYYQEVKLDISWKDFIVKCDYFFDLETNTLSNQLPTEIY